MFYSLASFFVRAFFRIVFFMRVEGKENVPMDGGLLFCANHQSNWDPPAVAAAFPRKISIMAKEELFQKPLLGRLIKALRAFPIRRGKGDAGAVMATLKLLGSGDATLVFPEGTRVRSEEERKREINPGIIRIAIKARVPILPCYTNGKYRPFGGLKVTFGKPISYEEYYDEAPDKETLQRLANELMAAIYSLAEVK